MEIALMLEGQMGLNWPRWQRMAQAAEELGFAGLYRSDHFTNPDPPDLDSLELWTSLTWLASHTRRIEFGPLVTPTSFRHPVWTARMARDVDDLSDGRLQLGLGAGWQDREHEMFGFDLLQPRERFARFAEGLRVIDRLLRGEGPQSFAGRYYHLKDAQLLPHPRRAGGPRFVIGGNGPQLTLPLAARYADEWNAVLVAPAEFTRLNEMLDGMIRAEGREPGQVRRTMMNHLAYGRDDGEAKWLLEGRNLERMTKQGALYGGPGEVSDRLAEFAEAGVQRIMLQWLDLDALDRLEHFAAHVLPHFHTQKTA